VKSENTYCTIHERKNGKKRRISSSPIMNYIHIPFLRKKYIEGCFVDNPVRKKMKYEDIEHVM
jgi:predicted DNA-binding helix-hairpin-helix protein